jgi:HD-GYP domain-containing protein (c-di-GMP phosphodiesterase class II)
MQTRVPSSELKIGMFVSSLDRPWIDTPFMLQGFLIEDQEDIGQLQQHCEFVLVDWSRSALKNPVTESKQRGRLATETAAKMRSPDNTNQTSGAGTKSPPARKDNRAAATPAVPVTYTARRSRKAKVRIPPQTTARNDGQSGERNGRANSDMEGILSELTGKMMSFFANKPKMQKASASGKHRRPASGGKTANNQRLAFIPRDIELSQYVEVRPVEEEIAPAIKAHDNASALLNNLIQDIKANNRFALEETENVILEVVDSMIRNPDAMMWVARLRKQDEFVYGQGLHTAVYLVALGLHLGLPKNMLGQLCTTGLLLDIGKIKLPKELLLKNGRLTPEEFEVVKNHVQLGLDVLEETPEIHPDVLQGIAQHHERENGSGYPAGLSKDDIGLFGRMSAIVDSFSAMTSPRPYGKAMAAFEALQSILNSDPGLYQAGMIEQFIQAIGVFPVGSMVLLSTGEVAVVISHSKVRRLKPRVLIISDSNKQPLPHPITLDLLNQPQSESNEEIYIQRGLTAGAFGLDTREYFQA